MRYVSIDIETTGLDSDHDQILEFAAIIEDTNNPLPFDEIPKFTAILNHERIMGSPFAINLNARIFKILAEIPESNEYGDYITKHNIYDPTRVASYFHAWLTLNDFDVDFNNKVEIIAAGKNFASFDKLFLEKLQGFKGLIRLSHRSIDPATLYCDFKNDEKLPSLDTCKKRAGIDGEVTHNALEDAWDVIEVLRKKY
jgi:oligoribonuclease